MKFYFHDYFRCDCETNYVMSSAGQCTLKPKNFKADEKKKTQESKTPPAKKLTTTKTKTSTKHKTRAQWFELMLYVCALVVFIAMENLLATRIYCQLLVTLGFWLYLYWFGLYLEKLALKYKKG